MSTEQKIETTDGKTTNEKGSSLDRIVGGLVERLLDFALTYGSCGDNYNAKSRVEAVFYCIFGQSVLAESFRVESAQRETNSVNVVIISEDDDDEYEWCVSVAEFLNQIEFSEFDLHVRIAR